MWVWFHLPLVHIFVCTLRTTLYVKVKNIKAEWQMGGKFNLFTLVERPAARDLTKSQPHVAKLPNYVLDDDCSLGAWLSVLDQKWRNTVMGDFMDLYDIDPTYKWIGENMEISVRLFHKCYIIILLRIPFILWTCGFH